MPFEMRGYMVELCQALKGERLLSIGKARQIGISTVLALYALWWATCHEGANVLLFSKGQVESKEMLKKVKDSWTQLPDFLRYKLEPDSTEEMGFPAMKSSIRAFPSTDSAGISFTASVMICDEHAEHPYAAQNFISAKPTIDSGGQFVSVFTKSISNPASTALAIFKDGIKGSNGFKSLFYPWTVVPGRDATWYEATKRSTPTEAMGTLTPELYMEVNYPSSLVQFLSTASDITAFDHRVLEEMAGDVKNPVGVSEVGIDPKVVHIYQPFHLGEYYVAGSDTAHGVGKDYSVTCVMNVRTGAVVADIMDNRLSPEEFADHSVRMLRLYKEPMWWIESNDWGGTTIATAQKLGYRHLGYQDDRRLKLGFNTMMNERRELFGALIPAINNHQITIFNADGIRQFMDVIRNAEKNGRIEAQANGHDDYPMAVGICWLEKDKVSRFDQMKPAVIHSLHFGDELVGARR